MKPAPDPRPILLPLLLVSLLTACGQAPEPTYFPFPESELEMIRSDHQSFMADTVLTGLVRPYSMAFLPDNRVLITERGGTIRLVEGGVMRENPVGGELPDGLRDIVLHPEYGRNGWIYITYYRDPDEESEGYAKLMRGRLDDDRWVDSELLYRAGPFSRDGFWTGSRVAFDRDGYLYFTVPIRGDRMNAQDLSHHSGKTMRLNDDGSVPQNNPFIGEEGVLPEIFTWGHREHQGLVLHPETGEIWSTEHGEFGGDELNILRAGKNYGWPIASYSLEYFDRTPVGPDTLLDGTEPPIHHWTPAIVPSGMTFVTGDRYPGWKGDIMIASLTHRVPVDSPPRMLHRSALEGERVVHDEGLIETVGRARTVRLAPDGYLYFITEDSGVMIRLLPAGED